MIDFCYFMNFSVLFQTFLYPDNLAWFQVCQFFFFLILNTDKHFPVQANYVLCMGVLMLAVVVWQNSLVFHSLDKLTSCAIHIFPPLTCHLVRWVIVLHLLSHLFTWQVGDDPKWAGARLCGAGLG